MNLSFPRKRESNFSPARILKLDARWSLHSGRAVRGPGCGHDSFYFICDFASATHSRWRLR